VAIRLVPCAQSIAQEELPPTIFSPGRRNEVVPHPAEGQTDVVLRVAFHPSTIPTLFIQQLQISFGFSLLPGILVPKECFDASRTIGLFLDEFADGH
jgi:hypothetical protein